MSGRHLAAPLVDDPSAVAEHQVYWAAVSRRDKAEYLLAVLNSDALLRRIQPLQGRGERNPRDFDKYVRQAPIPLYDPDDALHLGQAELARRAAAVAASVELPQQSLQALRRRVRTALVDDGVAGLIDDAVMALLDAVQEIHPTSFSPPLVEHTFYSSEMADPAELPHRVGALADIAARVPGGVAGLTCARDADAVELVAAAQARLATI